MDNPQFQQLQQLRRSGTTLNGSTTAGMIICRGGATLNGDGSSHHPVIATRFTKNKLSALHDLLLGRAISTLDHIESILLEMIRSCSCPAGRKQHATTTLGDFYPHSCDNFPAGSSGHGVCRELLGASALHCKHGVRLTAVPVGSLDPRTRYVYSIRHLSSLTVTDEARSLLASAGSRVGSLNMA
jgi:hypothetical protein